jgi:hypothetical protein
MIVAAALRATQALRTRLRSFDVAGSEAAT